MPDRPICKRDNCTNLAKISRKKGEVISYVSLCNTHSREASMAAHKSEKITPEKTPSYYSRPYRIWVEMRRRCNDSNRPYYKHYGGRGIKYSAEWESFAKFWEDMGTTYRDDLTLDRIDTNGDYSPENCRWANWFTQMNNRNYSHKLTFNGKTLGISEWSRVTGIKRTTINERLRTYGWSIEKTLTQGAK